MFLLGAIAVLLAVIVIHESGHFAAAVLFRIRVLGLYLGIPIPDLPFLPKLVRKLIRVIQFRFRLGKYPFTASPLLLGAMVDVNEEDLWEVPLFERLLVFLGGPLANIASLFAAAIMVEGIGGGLAYGWRVIYVTAVSPFLVLFGHVPPTQIMGPVGIVSFSAGYLSQGLGLEGFLRLFAVLSGAVGVFNLIPIPVLDGGRVVIAVLHKFGLPKRLASLLIVVSFVALIALMIWVTFNDVGRLP